VGIGGRKAEIGKAEIGKAEKLKRAAEARIWWIERSELDAILAAKPHLFNIALASFAEATACQGSGRSTSISLYGAC
jgi:hypothetical protein